MAVPEAGLESGGWTSVILVVKEVLTMCQAKPGLRCNSHATGCEEFQRKEDEHQYRAALYDPEY